MGEGGGHSESGVLISDVPSLPRGHAAIIVTGLPTCRTLNTSPMLPLHGTGAALGRAGGFAYPTRCSWPLGRDLQVVSFLSFSLPETPLLSAV